MLKKTIQIKIVQINSLVHVIGGRFTLKLNSKAIETMVLIVAI